MILSLTLSIKMLIISTLCNHCEELTNSIIDHIGLAIIKHNIGYYMLTFNLLI